MRDWIRRCGLALLAAAALPAGAVYVDPDGTGQALVFPYYTVNGEQQTVVSVVNTTSAAKVLQVNLREAYNGRLVLRFHVMLGAYDSWTATTFAAGDEDAGRLALRDDSCTLPRLKYWTQPGTIDGGPWQALFPFDYSGNNADGGPTTPARTREGYLEIVERAVLTGELAGDAANRNCAAFDNFITYAASSALVQAPRGGLRGSFAVIDVAEGTFFGGNAVAIEDFSARALFQPGEDLILFDAFGAANAGGGDLSARIFSLGRLQQLLYPSTRSVDALSALFMTDTLYGDVSEQAALGSHSEWIVTAPTKRFHVDGARRRTQIAPFRELFDESVDGGSCVRFEATLYDRRGRLVPLRPLIGGVPPPTLPGDYALCHAVDVVSLRGGRPTPVLGSALGVEAGYSGMESVEGALRLTLGSLGTARTFLPPGITGPGLRGLPVIGVEVVKYLNAAALPGRLANYTAARPLARQTSCTDASGNAAGCF